MIAIILELDSASDMLGSLNIDCGLKMVARFRVRERMILVCIG